MKTPIWLVAVCMAASLPLHAETFKPIELKDQELANLRGRFVMPGRIVSFGIVMSSTWQNAQGQLIGATAQMQIQQSTIKPQFYVSTISENASNGANSQPVANGTGTVTGGNGLTTTQGVTQAVRAAGDYNTAYNDVDINVSKGNQADSVTPQGQVLSPGQTISSANGAGTMSVSSTGAGGVQMNIVANNNQGNTLQQLAQGGLLQNTTLLGGSNAVRNLTQLNVVLRDSAPNAGSVGVNLDQLKGLRNLGY